MPEIPDVVAGQFVESSWGNDIRDRTVQRYADATERDALNPLPVPGDLAYLDGTGEVQVYTGGAWFPIARSSYQSLLVYGDSQGYWLRPDPNDNTQDWRLVGGGGRVQLQTRASGTFVTVADWFPNNRQPVTPLPYSNGWETYFTRLAVWQLPGGTVHLQGMIRNGTGPVISTGGIPAAMRPSSTQIWWLADSTKALQRIEVNSAGSLSINGSAPAVGTWLTFAGMSWMAGE